MFKKVQLVASYIIDVVVLVIFAGLGGALNYVSPTRRLFSVTDPTIAYPNLPDTVTVPTLFIVAVIVPAVLICAVALLFITRFDDQHIKMPRAAIWRRKLWELFAGLLGLAFSVVLGFFITQAAKNLFGKPRPDFLSRCRPNIANFNDYVDGGFSNELLEGTSIHVQFAICQATNGTATDKAALDDGFRSFPSGHCTIAFAGLAYLSLFLATKFSATIPHLSRASRKDSEAIIRSDDTPRQSEPRGETAAPPIYLFVLAFIPFAAAIYIASTRFRDYKHHGFDVFFSSVEGTICAWLGFRWYHMPLRRGAGWAWGPRSADRAFGIRVGTGTYHEPRKEGRSIGRGDGQLRDDIELGTVPRPGTFNSDSSRAQIIRA